MWQSRPDSPPLDVAIKTLKLSAKENDRVKFLQEGAIMGQFRHLNIVKLYGIVREEKTVCLYSDQGLQHNSTLTIFLQVFLVIELLAKTDLSRHLVSLRPQYVHHCSCDVGV